MTVLDRVRKLIIRLAPEPICDACIATLLDLSATQHANGKTREIAGTQGFVRSRNLCTICSAEKLVTGYRRQDLTERAAPPDLTPL